MRENKELAEMGNLFLALADRTRLRLLNLIRENEVSVCRLAEVLGESQPKISRHLAYLRNAGIVSARREGKRIYYSIEIPADSPAVDILGNVLEWLNSQEEMWQEYKKLAGIQYKNEVVPEKSREAELNTSDEAYIITGRRAQLETFLL